MSLTENELSADICTLAAGTRVTKWIGNPRLLDMAWGVCRIGRWNGTGDHWYSLMNHTFVVSDLCPGHVKIFALLHDAAPECCGNDVPKPMKTKETGEIEEGIFIRTLQYYGIGIPTEEEAGLVKHADIRAAFGEAWIVGNEGQRNTYPLRDYRAEALTAFYRSIYPDAEMIGPRAGLRASTEFLRRFVYYRDLRFKYLAALGRHGMNA